MTPPVEERFRVRLAALSDAVPVEPRAARGETATRTVRPTIRTMAMPGALAMAALIVMVVVGASWLVGRAPATPGSGAITGTTRNGDFELTIRADKSSYGVNEPITASASLVYRGSQPSITVAGAGSLIAFGVEQLDGAHHVVEPVSVQSLRLQPLQRGQPIEMAFSKSGAASPTDPDAAFILSYLAEPQLRLTQGTWRIFAATSFSETTPGPELSWRAGVVVTVGEPQDVVPTTAPSPSPTADPFAFPAACSMFSLGADQCAYLAAWAVAQSGVSWERLAAIDFHGSLPNYICPAGAACAVPAPTPNVTRVRVTATDGSFSEPEPRVCLVGNLCPIPAIYPAIRGPAGGGYRDVQCPSPAPNPGCATPLPTIDASAAAEPLNLDTFDIPIDHAGPYSVVLGQASLPNGILSATTAALASSPADPLVSFDGYLLTVRSLDGGPPFENYYQHGWRPGVEHVEVSLSFTVLQFQPGAVLHLANIDVH